MDNNYAIDLINVLSYIIGVENLKMNDEQVNKLDNHLTKQDKQYEEIIELINSLKEECYGRTNEK